MRHILFILLHLAFASHLANGHDDSDDEGSSVSSSGSSPFVLTAPSRGGAQYRGAGAQFPTSIGVEQGRSPFRTALEKHRDKMEVLEGDLAHVRKLLELRLMGDSRKPEAYPGNGAEMNVVKAAREQTRQLVIACEGLRGAVEDLVQTGLQMLSGKLKDAEKCEAAVRRELRSLRTFVLIPSLSKDLSQERGWTSSWMVNEEIAKVQDDCRSCRTILEQLQEALRARLRIGMK